MTKVNQLLSKLDRASSIAPLVLRVTLGTLLLLNGLDKFSAGIAAVTDAFTSMGVPLPSVTAPLAAVLEVAIGIGLIAGFATRLSGVVMTGFFAVAIATVKAEGGILGSADIDLLYTAGLVALVFLGPGALAIDNIIAKRAERKERVTKSPRRGPTIMPTPEPTLA